MSDGEIKVHISTIAVRSHGCGGGFKDENRPARALRTEQNLDTLPGAGALRGLASNRK